MIRVRWRKDGEWFSGCTEKDGRVWDPHRYNAIKFRNQSHFRRFEREMILAFGGTRWTTNDVEFVKVKGT